MANALRSRNVKFKTTSILSKGKRFRTKAMQQVAKEMTRALKKRIGRQGPPRSRPGNAPKKDTGFLHREGTTVSVRGQTFTLKTPQYGIWLETGTGRMAARPWIRKVIHDQSKKWNKKITAAIRKLTPKTTKSVSRRAGGRAFKFTPSTGRRR